MIQEFFDHPDNITGKRILPLTDDSIRQFVKTRNPFNHMTVFFKKEAVIDAGNYQHLIGYEDYWLWARVLASGGGGANLPDFLVNVRAGENMLRRRRGWNLFKAEVSLAENLKSLQILTTTEMIRNILLKGTVRLLPVFLLRLVYSRMREK